MLTNLPLITAYIALSHYAEPAKGERVDYEYEVIFLLIISAKLITYWSFGSLENAYHDIYNMMEKNKIIYLENTKPKKYKIISRDTSDLG
ncbi:MAG: hypothetical protein KKA10_17280 [Euryarchaeota archaeon]|nr:hypothetical protein [Euryarchaeota archaeon]MCG2738167.1 hypothetical protein [Candidatus Methanoperedenaceae archaeon]